MTLCGQTGARLPEIIDERENNDIFFRQVSNIYFYYEFVWYYQVSAPKMKQDLTKHLKKILAKDHGTGHWGLSNKNISV